MFIKKVAYIRYMPIITIFLSVSLLSAQATDKKTILAIGKTNILAIASGIGSAKIITGVARVITDVNQLGKVGKGDIIVTSMTEASWEPVLNLVAAIITDGGNDNCHAAVFGKKMGIPVIVATINATAVIIDGQVIAVEESQGCVYGIGEEETIDISSSAQYSGKSPVIIASLSDTDYQIDTTRSYKRMDSADEFSDKNGKKQKEKVICSAEQLYGKYYHNFKDYVLDMQYELKKGRFIGAVEWGARHIKKYNEFTISCIPISYPFFDHNPKTIIRILQLVGDKKYINLVNRLIERCKEKPNNMKAMDWVAQVAHEEHVRSITLPAGVKREKLMSDPKKYQKYVEEDKVPAEERDALIATGLFARYLVEEGLI